MKITEITIARPGGSRAGHCPGILACLRYLFFAALLSACGDDGRPPSSGEPPDTAPQPAAQDRPNILLIMADDFGYNDLAINNGNTLTRTPNLDDFARQGMRFTRHYATAVCSPARAALLAGQYPERHGYLSDGRGLSAQVSTLPEQLQEAGYNTWHIGKWHLGDVRREAWPDHQGFDHWFGFLNQWRLAGKKSEGAIQLARPRYHNPWLEGDQEPGRHHEGHLENILTDKAIEVMSALNGQGEPWLINLWYFSPHSPIQPASDYAARYPENAPGRYRALIQQLDDNVGKLLEKLDELGAASNTIVIFISDNGGTGKQIDSNKPFAGAKGSLMEGGVRTPLLIRWPDARMNQRSVDTIASVLDIYPTLLDALGITVPGDLDGHSLLNHLRDGDPAPRRPLFWEQSGGFGVLSSDGRWRLHSLPWLPQMERTIRLYDLEHDPNGATEVTEPPQATVNTLLRTHARWYRDVHQVETDYARLDDGSATLSGMDMLRTPGFGGYSFGMGIAAQASGTLAQQAGIWSLHREGDKVEASFGEAKLSGRISDPGKCHSIIVSGIFYRHISASAGPDQTSLTLYINGKKADRVTVDGALKIRDLSLPTVIGRYGHSLRPPVILNIPVDISPIITPQSLSEELCEELP